MKLTASLIVSFVLLTSASGEGNEMVKMCLFYPNESGHARSDPIVDQQFASSHVHTFYGPQNFHPNTSYEDLRDTPARFSSSPFVENQSLYWVSFLFWNRIRMMEQPSSGEDACLKTEADHSFLLVSYYSSSATMYAAPIHLSCRGRWCQRPADVHSSQQLGNQPPLSVGQEQ